jgi:hypothetical protein
MPAIFRPSVSMTDALLEVSVVPCADWLGAAVVLATVLALAAGVSSPACENVFVFVNAATPPGATCR